jgi:hypothetical protein
VAKLNHHHLRFPRGKQNTNTVRQIPEEKRRRKQKQKATGTGEDEIRRRSGLVVRRPTPPSSHHHLLHVYIARGKFGLKGRSMQILDTRERSEIFCFREKKGLKR